MRILGMFFVVLLCLAWPASGAPAGAVASIVAIDGTVSSKASGSTQWAPARVNQSEYAHDQVRTDASSMAALEFTVGGKIGLSHSTTVEVTGPRQARDAATGTEIKLSSGSIWATMSPQKAPFEIKTRSCTIGIRGTEFVVDDSSGETEVSVLSGEVGVTDDANRLTIARPGQVLRVRRGQRPQLRTLDVTQLRRQLQQRHGRFMQFLMTRRRANSGVRP